MALYTQALMKRALKAEAQRDLLREALEAIMRNELDAQRAQEIARAALAETEEGE